jgi:hypothetical protein
MPVTWAVQANPINLAIGGENASAGWSPPSQMGNSRLPSAAVTPSGELRSPEADRAGIETPLLGTPPPGVIFAPGRRSPMLLRLQTADHIRLPSPVQEEQGAPAACHRARIMRFPMGEEHHALALRFPNRGGRICSAMRWPHISLPCVCEEQTSSAF